jgi:glycosyltransferase involved in cell wall biosynthesis
MGGAVENMIARLHHCLGEKYEFHYVSVSPPEKFRVHDSRFDNAIIHEIQSINPLADFHPDNQFELQESEKWTAYTEHCCDVARHIQPHVVHIHNEVRLAGPLAEAAPNARIIVHVNDEVVTRLGRSELEQTARKVDVILSCSRYIASQIARSFDVHSVAPPRMDIFYNFVDTAEFNSANIDRGAADRLREQYGLGDVPVIGFVGRMIEQKGPQTLIRAVRKLRRAGVKSKLLFVGAPWYSRDESTLWLEYLKREIDDFSTDVVFTGYLRHTEIPACYSLIDVMAVPSVWDDPSPFVAYEAQAMALPVVSSMRGGIPEIVADWQTGRCIDVYNTPLFADVLAEWIENPSEAGKIGAKGRERVTDLFSLERACNQMHAVYESLRLS